MRYPRIIIAGIGLAAVATVSGVTAASASVSTASTKPSASGSAVAGTTVRTTSAAVGGKTETILVNGQGLPLYIYKPDMAAHDSAQAEAGRQQSGQSGDHGAVGPVQPRAGNLTAQDTGLVPKYQDLRVLGSVAQGEEDQPAKQPHLSR
jgi:hypothetical protein